MAAGDRVWIPAQPETGVIGWEIAPCLEHADPHDCTSYTEAYDTVGEAENDAYEGTGEIFWGVYAHFRESVQSAVITPSMHIMDFQCHADAQEFVRAMTCTARQEDE